MKINDYSKFTLSQMDQMFRQGQISREVAEEYVKQWNASGKHLTTAKVYAFSIGNR